MDLADWCLDEARTVLASEIIDGARRSDILDDRPLSPRRAGEQMMDREHEGALLAWRISQVRDQGESIGVEILCETQIAAMCTYRIAEVTEVFRSRLRFPRRFDDNDLAPERLEEKSGRFRSGAARGVHGNPKPAGTDPLHIDFGTDPCDVRIYGVRMALLEPRRPLVRWRRRAVLARELDQVSSLVAVEDGIVRSEEDLHPVPLLRIVIGRLA
jgi:hypothetical protein